jgi:hypothetical protein
MLYQFPEHAAQVTKASNARQPPFTLSLSWRDEIRISKFETKPACLGIAYSRRREKWEKTGMEGVLLFVLIFDIRICFKFRASDFEFELRAWPALIIYFNPPNAFAKGLLNPLACGRAFSCGRGAGAAPAGRPADLRPGTFFIESAILFRAISTSTTVTSTF